MTWDAKPLPSGRIQLRWNGELVGGWIDDPPRRRHHYVRDRWVRANPGADAVLIRHGFAFLPAGDWWVAVAG